MAAPNIQVRNDPQVVTGGTAGTKLIGPTTVEGDLTVTGAINGGGSGGITIAAAGRAVTDAAGNATILTPAVQLTSVILITGFNDPSGNINTPYNIVPGVSFDVVNAFTAPDVEFSWTVINP